jgi:hypothetical protein
MKALMWSIGFGIVGFSAFASVPYVGAYIGPVFTAVATFFTVASATFLFVQGIKLFGKK